MIDEHDAEQGRTGEQQGAAEEPASTEAASANELVTADEPDLAEDAGLGEAEQALLRWAFRQRQRALGEPLLPTGDEPLPPPETPTPPAGTAPTPVPAPRPTPPAGTAPTQEHEVAPFPAPQPKPMRLWPEPAADAPPAPTPGPVRPPAPRPQAAAVRQPAPRPGVEPGRAEERPATAWERLHEAAEEAISALVAAGGPDPRDYASPRLDRRAKMVIAVALVVLFMVSVLGGFLGYRLTHRAAGAGPEAASRPAGIHAAAPATRSV
jgi:hypothetical protein